MDCAADVAGKVLSSLLLLFGVHCIDVGVNDAADDMGRKHVLELYGTLACCVA